MSKRARCTDKRHGCLDAYARQERARAASGALLLPAIVRHCWARNRPCLLIRYFQIGRPSNVQVFGPLRPSPCLRIECADTCRGAQASYNARHGLSGQLRLCLASDVVKLVCHEVQLQEAWSWEELGVGRPSLRAAITCKCCPSRVTLQKLIPSVHHGVGAYCPRG